MLDLSYSFEEIMAYHKGNRRVYNEIKRSLSKLVPFVGAGLTQFAYGTWPEALKALTGMLAGPENVQEVTRLIDGKHYMDAAQKLEELRAPANLARDIAALFSRDKLDAKRAQLRKEPIALLPYLFPELVLTTNFDETLEAAYSESGHRFAWTFLPGHSELLRELLHEGGTNGLLKLHGSITGGLIEYSRIVFTKAQYDRHYGTGRPLVKELKECFKNRAMLFLGCSLEMAPDKKDRFVEILQKSHEEGYTHYTIKDCEKTEIDEKSRELGENHIQAILYESNRHEAVRVILEHLLEETNPDVYRALSVHVGALKSINMSERFSYKAEIIPFTGREQELEELQEFLGKPDIAFRWWAVIGPGGAGKSRLAYEFKERASSDWDVRYLGAEDYEDLSRLTENLVKKTLLVADYVQEHAKTIGKWMAWLREQPRSLPVRVLLVERNTGDNLDRFGWTEQLYGDVRHKKELQDACFRESFLILQPLRDEDLLSIMGNYALAVKPGISLLGRQKQVLLQKLKTIDPELCRPLYALFLTDAYVNGQNPERWNKNDVLDYIKEREESRLKFNIKQVLGGIDEKLWDACLWLQYTATVLQDASLQDLKLLCPESWVVIERKADSFRSPESMLEQIGLAAGGQVPALRPDLIGEYAVYTWLQEHPEKSQEFLTAVWEKPHPAVAFFSRLISDYGYLLGKNETYSDIAIVLAKNLLNMISKQDEKEALDTAQSLERLTEKHSTVPNIASQSSNSQVNLSSKRDKQRAWKTVRRLEHLTEVYPDVPDIAIQFARSLANLTEK